MKHKTNEMNSLADGALPFKVLFALKLYRGIQIRWDVIFKFVLRVLNKLEMYLFGKNDNKVSEAAGISVFLWVCVSLCGVRVFLSAFAITHANVRWQGKKMWHK